MAHLESSQHHRGHCDLMANRLTIRGQKHILGSSTDLHKFLKYQLAVLPYTSSLLRLYDGESCCSASQQGP